MDLSNRSDHLMSLLKSLHCLSVHDKIHHNVLVLTFTVPNGLAHPLLSLLPCIQSRPSLWYLVLSLTIFYHSKFHYHSRLPSTAKPASLGTQCQFSWPLQILPQHDTPFPKCLTFWKQDTHNSSLSYWKSEEAKFRTIPNTEGDNL